jgi:hypothetical protein
VKDKSAPSSAGLRFWELSGGIAYCPCGCRLATHTANRKDGRAFYYVCGKVRYQRKPCENSKYHPAEELEGRIRSFALDLIRNPDVLRDKVLKRLEAERRALSNPQWQIQALHERIAKIERKKRGYREQSAEGLIPM